MMAVKTAQAAFLRYLIFSSRSTKSTKKKAFCDVLMTKVAGPNRYLTALINTAPN